GVAFGAWVLGSGIWQHWQRERANGIQQAALTGLVGTWDVVKLVRDGQEIPATPDEKTRWKTVGLAMYKGNGRLIYRQMDDFYDRVGFEHDAAKKTLTLEPDGAPKTTLVYTQPNADHATLAGDFGGHTIAAELRRRPPREYRLVTRGFHWINEAPYNR
ncbi:MAG: putative rane protein, partial [bacterium]|nr:putative rane protein [bacterium]